VKNDDVSTIVWQTLDRVRSGEREKAFFTLLEAGDEVVPELKTAFEHESDTACRALIVEVLWQRRDPAIIPFLAAALNDSATEVWQTALDGLVAIGSPEALAALQAVRQRVGIQSHQLEEFRSWIDEAIEQIDEQQ
jgi:HEAT repeat protein